MPAGRQLSLIGPFMGSVEILPDPGADYGEVFTRRWVVDLILDLVGYTADEDLGACVLVEPSCGTGAFLLPIVDRLIESSAWRGHDLQAQTAAIRAYDLLDANAERTRKAVALRLVEAGLAEDEARDLARAWISTGDFLLHDHEPNSADYVVGNPPYIRLENVARPIMDAYRRACPTMRGRSDIYVGFIERGLDLLKPGGALSYICADRWMRNQYGAELRQLITRSYAVETVLSMHDVAAFEDDVSAYPAIVVLRNTQQVAATVIQAKKTFTQRHARGLSTWVHRRDERDLSTDDYEASRVARWFSGRELWPSGSPAQLALIAELQERYAPLQDTCTGTRVGIGVATGCDDVFIAKDPVGLYLNPPDKAVVLCMDEKASVQALDRTQASLPMKKGRAGTMTHDYKRNGTTTLFAALDVLTGLVIGQCLPRHRHDEFLKFLRRIDKEVPKGLAVHLILDNYATHKHPNVKAWLAKHSRFELHFTPTSSSWLNLVERWFRDITDKAIRRGVFPSVPDLIAAIEDYIQANNANPTPFVWTATAASILEKVQRGRVALQTIAS